LDWQRVLMDGCSLDVDRNFLHQSIETLHSIGYALQGWVSIVLWVEQAPIMVCAEMTTNSEKGDGLKQESGAGGGTFDHLAGLGKARGWVEALLAESASHASR
jgi:hypothetical protein